MWPWSVPILLCAIKQLSKVTSPNSLFCPSKIFSLQWYKTNLLINWCFSINPSVFTFLKSRQDTEILNSHVHSQLLYFMCTFGSPTSCWRPSPTPSFHLSKSTASQFLKMGRSRVDPAPLCDSSRWGWQIWSHKFCLVLLNAVFCWCTPPHLL